MSDRIYIRFGSGSECGVPSYPIDHALSSVHLGGVMRFKRDFKTGYLKTLPLGIYQVSGEVLDPPTSEAGDFRVIHSSIVPDFSGSGFSRTRSGSFDYTYGRGNVTLPYPNSAYTFSGTTKEVLSTSSDYNQSWALVDYQEDSHEVTRLNAFLSGNEDLFEVPENTIVSSLSGRRTIGGGVPQLTWSLMQAPSYYAKSDRYAHIFHKKVPAPLDIASMPPEKSPLRSLNLARTGSGTGTGYRDTIGTSAGVVLPAGLHVSVTGFSAYQPSELVSILQGASSGTILFLGTGSDAPAVWVTGTTVSGSYPNIKFTFGIDVDNSESPHNCSNGTPIQILSWLPLSSSVSGVYVNNSPYNPAEINIDVTEQGKIRDVRVWVEFVHDIRVTGSDPTLTNISDSGSPAHGLQAVQIALRSPNMFFNSAHPLWNDPSVVSLSYRPDVNVRGNVDQFGDEYQNIPEILKNSYLLWDGHLCSRPTLEIALGTASGVYNRYHEFDNDIDMRTVFWDAAVHPNTREVQMLYPSATIDEPSSSLEYGTLTGSKYDQYRSPTSASLKNYVDPTLNLGRGDLTCSNFPWMYDRRVPAGRFTTDGLVYITHISGGGIPPGWLGAFEPSLGGPWESTRINAGMFQDSTYGQALPVPFATRVSGAAGTLHYVGGVGSGSIVDVLIGDGVQETVIEYLTPSCSFQRYAFDQSVITPLGNSTMGAHNLPYGVIDPSLTIFSAKIYTKHLLYSIGGATASFGVIFNLGGVLGDTAYSDVNASDAICSASFDPTGNAVWGPVITGTLPYPGIAGASALFVAGSPSGCLCLFGGLTGTYGFDTRQTGSNIIAHVPVDSLGRISGSWSTGSNVLPFVAWKPSVATVCLKDGPTVADFIFVSSGSKLYVSRAASGVPGVFTTSSLDVMGIAPLPSAPTFSKNLVHVVTEEDQKHFLYVLADVTSSFVSELNFDHVQNKLSMSAWSTVTLDSSFTRSSSNIDSTSLNNGQAFFLDLIHDNSTTGEYGDTIGCILGQFDPDTFVTEGDQLGPAQIRPVYPILDDIYVRKIWDEPLGDNVDAPHISSNRKEIIGFRPGLRGTEMSGTWKLLIAGAEDPSAPIDQVRGILPDAHSGLWIRQVRLEFVKENGERSWEMYPSKERRFKRADYVPVPEGPRLISIVSGSSEWDVGLNYVETITMPEYGRTISITDDPFVPHSSWAVHARITGLLSATLAARGEDPSEWFLKNQFGTPYIPDSTSSLSFGTSSIGVEIDRMDVSGSKFMFDSTMGIKPSTPSANDLTSLLNRSNYAKTTLQRWEEANAQLNIQEGDNDLSLSGSFSRVHRIGQNVNVVLLLSSNNDRTGFSIFNDSNSSMNIFLDRSSDSSFPLSPKTLYENEQREFTGEVGGQWVTSGSGEARVTEYTR